MSENILNQIPKPIIHRQLPNPNGFGFILHVCYLCASFEEYRTLLSKIDVPIWRTTYKNSWVGSYNVTVEFKL